MPLYRKETYTTTGTKDSLNLDPTIAPFQAAVACTLGTTGTYKVQFSLDPMTITDANATWQDSTGIPASTTSSATTTFVGPVSRIRVVIAALDSSLVLQVAQGISVN